MISSPPPTKPPAGFHPFPPAFQTEASIKTENADLLSMGGILPTNIEEQGKDAFL